MILDAVTVRNLELMEPLFAGERKESTLVHVLDQTCTGMGGRLLRSRLLRPSIDIGGDRGAAGCGGAAGRRRPSSARSCARRSAAILDLERLLAKVTLGTASPRDLLALGRRSRRFRRCSFDTGGVGAAAGHR